MLVKRALPIFLAFISLHFALAQGDLFATARDGLLSEVSDLLTQGVNVNETDAYGQTPLMYAATGNQDPDVITVLIDAGADVDAETLAGWTALMYAVRDNPNPEVAQRLLDLAADADIRNGEGKQALDYAEENTLFRASSAYTQLSDLTTVEVEEPVYTPPPAAETRVCCKYCTTGKACGDSCISQSYNCYRGVGCACNASDIDETDPAYAMVQKLLQEARATKANPIAEIAAPLVDCSFAAAIDSVLTTALMRNMTAMN